LIRRAGFLASIIKVSGTAALLRPPNGEVMSIVLFATFIALTVAQVAFWESLGETFGYAASISVVGLCASITLILAAYLAATHTFRPGKSL
jgi:hypothetical protein